MPGYYNQRDDQNGKKKPAPKYCHLGGFLGAGDVDQVAEKRYDGSCDQSQGKIDLVITGADRIAANGDTANKIGTMSLSVLCKHFDIPLYIAAPGSTFDLTIQAGKDIPIEERDPEEVKAFAGVPTAPEKVEVYNPAFDVTLNENITAFITDKGIIYPPFKENIEKAFE